MKIWDVLSVNANRMKQLLNNTTRCLNHVFLQEQQKNYWDDKTLGTNCSVVLWHGRTCSKMRWAILWNGKQESAATVQSNPALAWMTINSSRKNSNHLEIFFQKFAHTLSWNACNWHELEDLTFSGQSTSLRDHSQTGLRHVTDAWQGWFLTFITNDFRQYCHVGNTAQHCRLGMFQDSDFAGDLEDSKSTLGGILCIFGSRTSVPVSRMCKKQTSVSHSSTESEVLSLDAGLRMELLIFVTSWLKYFVQPKTLSNPTMLAWGKPVQDTIPKPRHQLTKERPTSTHPSQGESLSFTYLKTTKPRSKWLSNDHRVALDWFNLEPKIPKTNSLTSLPKEVVNINQKARPPSWHFFKLPTIEKPYLLICSCLFSGFRVQTGNCPESDGGCGQHTWPDARTRTFFSLSVSHFTHARSAWLKMLKVKRVRVIILRSFPSRSLMSLLNIPHCSFPQVLSSPTGSLSRLSASTTSVGRSFREKPCELAVGFLAEWLTQLQTQVVSPTPPTSSATWTRSTRRFTSPTETTISSAKTTPPWSPPLTLKVCRTQEHPAAASKQQQAEFLQCSDFQASGNRWQVMCLVDQASRKLWRFRTETLLQQRFLVHSRKGREIDNRCAFVERQSKSSKNPWTESWLGRPRRNNGSAKIVWRWGWGWGEKLGKEKFRLRLSGDQSRILRSAISTTPSKSMGRSGSERQDYLVWRI